MRAGSPGGGLVYLIPTILRVKGTARELAAGEAHDGSRWTRIGFYDEGAFLGKEDWLDGTVFQSLLTAKLDVSREFPTSGDWESWNLGCG